MNTLLLLAAGVAAGWYWKTKACACSHAADATTTQTPLSPTEASGSLLATNRGATITDSTSSSGTSGITLGVDSKCATGTCGGGAKTGTTFSLANRRGAFA